MQSRLFYLMKKEFTQVLRDPRMLFIALLAPVIQLFIFGYVTTLDIKHISTAVYDQDHTLQSRQIAESFKNAGYFDLNFYPKSEAEINKLMDSNLTKAALVIPVNFTRKILKGKSADLQVILDGTDSNTAMIASSYIAGINWQNSLKIMTERLQKRGVNSAGPPQIDPRLRIWYNPELKSINFFVPAIICMLLMLETMILTALAIVKEKERGTLEQLIVTPLLPRELILGKMLPFVIISLLDITFVILVGTLWFKVPIMGSLILLYVLSLIFIFTSLGFGIFISTISITQQQAMLSAIFVLIPSMLLSGFIFPITNMPYLIQLFTYLIPARYFIEIVRGIFLKGVGFDYLWSQAVALIILGGVVFSLSIIRFRKKLE